MSILTKKTAPSLSAQLQAKQAELSDTAVDKADEATELAALAAQARQDGLTAAAHADAVNRAIGILEDAGVSL
ncbi:hypothetical protein SEA_CELAENA_62 [Microbacterium phage Celaena]|uniref:hypothetical protein n=1 Tax=Microbacterium phage Celaena TaxID=2591214 RepID=UPI00116449BD|nr:hypothetical protein QDW17_gp62 [Microbacterium phage Celaena]YP_010752389.1 hypothetical protein QDW18_gp63 [Microbacterium phage Katzastrophic]QDH92441.1 hypothetical protein SEA_CELAENA_62 [Microbacterium phage Celaena]UKH48500.1 hypothetical protein SEA_KATZASTROPHIC_63 [Microbacterium phage Katzastrophic]